MAVVLYFLRRWQRLTVFLGSGLALILSGLAAWLNVGVVIRFAGQSFAFTDTLTVLGRRFVLDNNARPVMLVIYLVTTFWLGGVLASRVGRLAVPLGLGIVALLTAALAVDPFLYAALLIEMAVLGCVPLVTPPGRPVGRGVLRFLVFQSLGMMLLLFTGWIMAGVEANPEDRALAARAMTFFGLGFALLLAVIPFQTWIPMLAEEAHPYAAGLIFLMLPEMVMLFGLSFLDRYAWLRETSSLYSYLTLAGVVSVFIGGWWAASQRHLGRMLGYAVIVEIGYSLLAVGIPGGIPLHFSLLIPRALGFGVFSLALSAIRAHTGSLDIRQVQGAARRMPFAAAGVVMSLFTLAGFPLLAGFPAHLALWEAAGKQALWAALWSVLGSAGLLAAGLRSLVVLLSSPKDTPWQVSETRLEALFLALGLIALLAVGLFSQLYFPALTGLAQGLEYISP
jgi:formate hydrogenlyase subunit 3/multisubunit Na+/H+ antiporter MnhD subunit